MFRALNQIEHVIGLFAGGNVNGPHLIGYGQGVDPGAGRIKCMPVRDFQAYAAAGAFRRGDEGDAGQVRCVEPAGIFGGTDIFAADPAEVFALADAGAFAAARGHV